MVTAVLERIEQNTYENTYVLEVCYFQPQAESRGTTAKVKSLTASVRWLQRMNLFEERKSHTFNSLKEPTILNNNDIKSGDLNKFLYTVPQTATLLSCSPATVYKYIATGKLLAVYPTTRARISVTSISNFVKQLEKEAREEGRGY